MNTQFQILAEFLSDVDGGVEIEFWEDSAADNRGALNVACHQDPGLARWLAEFFGARDGELPLVSSFQADDSWHGRGGGNLQLLADEIAGREGRFFSVIYTVDEIRGFAAK